MRTPTIYKRRSRMSNETITHLQFIQNVIDRMNRNSFQLKELSMTIVSALLALYASSNNCRYVLVAIIPTIIFALLDAYYLLQERKFRCLYNDIISNAGQIIPLAMPINLYCDGVRSYLKVVVSKTVLWFYLPIVIILLIGGIVLS